MHRPVTPDVRIPSGHERASAGSADRVLTKSILEGYGFSLNQAIQVGCHRPWIAQMTGDIPTPLIRIKDNQIRILQLITISRLQIFFDYKKELKARCVDSFFMSVR